MSTTLRSLFAVCFLFAAGCAADPFEDESPEEERAAQTEDQKEEEASQAKVDESNLAILKKGRIDTLGRKESGLPKK